MPASTLTPTHVPAEVVTRAQVDYHDLPGDAGRFAVITLDNGVGKPNTFGPGGLAALEAALDEIAGDQVVGARIIGQSRGFAAGADLRAVAAIESREQRLALRTAGHHAFRRFGQLPVPTFAFLNGSALDPADLPAIGAQGVCGRQLRRLPATGILGHRDPAHRGRHRHRRDDHPLDPAPSRTGAHPDSQISAPAHGRGRRTGSLREGRCGAGPFSP